MPIVTSSKAKRQERIERIMLFLIQHSNITFKSKKSCKNQQQSQSSAKR